MDKKREQELLSAIRLKDKKIHSLKTQNSTFLDTISDLDAQLQIVNEDYNKLVEELNLIKKQLEEDRIPKKEVSEKE